MITSANPKVPIHILTLGKRAIGRDIQIDMKDISQCEMQSVKDLAGEVFWDYYTFNTPIREDIPQERIINAKLLEWVKKSPSWESSKMNSLGNSIVSAMSSRFLTMYLMTDEVIRDALKEEEKIEQLQSLFDQLQQEAENAGKQTKKDEEKSKESKEKEQKAKDKANEQPENKEAQEDAKNAENERKNSEQKQKTSRQKANEAQQRANDAKKELEKSMSKAQQAFDRLEKSTFSGAIRSNAIKEAKEKGEEVKAILNSLGWDDSHSENITQQEIQEFMEFYNKKGEIGKSFAKYFGRAKGIAIAHKSKKSDFNTVIFNAGYTRKINNLFPSEKAALHPQANPVIRATKVIQFCQRGLLGMVEGKPPKSEGSFIAAIDDSGSMKGDKSLMAKAVNWGLCEAAKLNGQKYVCFRFSDSESDTPTITSDSEPKEKLEWLLQFMSRGTDFNLALNYSMDKLEEMDEDDRENTDILITTDGQSSVDKETIARYNRLHDLYGTRLIELFIPNSLYERYYSNQKSALEAITDYRIVIPERDINVDDLTTRLAEILEKPHEKKSV